MRHSNEHGFTLVELMVVLVVLGILAAIIIPDFMSRMDRTREAGVKTNMHTLQLAAEDYAVENSGHYSDILDAAHVANRLPTAFVNPFSRRAGAGVAWEDRPALSAAPSLVPGIASYADSDSAVYNIKGVGKAGVLPLVLTAGQ